MKNKIKAFLFLAFGLAACTSAFYLPTAETIDVNQYGSQISVYPKKGNMVKGELIAIDTVNLIVLPNTAGKKQASVPVSIPLNNISHFSLRYATPRHYGWSIPLFTAVTLLHGYYAVITLPVNLIGTICVTVGGESAFTVSRVNGPIYKDLRMYARFPQGIPPGIELSQLKR